MEPEYIAPENKTETEELEVSGSDYLDTARAFLIQNERDYISADTFNTNGKEQIKKIEAHCDPRIKTAHELHKDLLGDKNKFLEPIKQARRVIGHKMSIYMEEQKRIRLVKEAEDRKVALQKEQDRKEAELQRKRVESQQLKEAGRHEESQAVLYAPDPMQNTPVAKPISQPAVPKTETKFRIGWNVDVIDLDKVPDEFIIHTADIQLIKARVKSYKGKIEIPGCLITETKTPY
jgi:hypothetical protein